MDILFELNDQVLFGEPTRSQSPPHYAARAILHREDDLFGLMHIRAFQNYMTPGGGIEPGEDPVSALKRELLEETGCEVSRLEELGTVYENRGSADTTKYSYFYVVHTVGETQPPALTQAELDQGYRLCWHPLEEAIRLLEAFRPQTRQQVYLNTRDLGVFRFYRDRIQK